MKTVLFIDNAHNYEWILDVALKLKEKNKIKPVFLTFIKNKKKEAERIGVDTLFLGEVSVAEREATRSILKEIEVLEKDFDLELAIKRDRVLTTLNRKKAENIVLDQCSFMLKALEQKKPDLILGEISWANEYAFYFLAKHFGVAYRHLLNLPTKNCRLVFFDHRHSAEETLYLGRYLEESERNFKTINYSDLLDKVKQRKLGLVSYLISFSKIYSFRDYRTWLRYKNRYFLKFLYGVFYFLIERIFGKEAISKDFCSFYFPLHVQPESTPDFVSIHYSDQMSLIKRISDNLPKDSVLYIKEHPSAISIRKIFDWFSILSRSNVRLLKRGLNGIDCIRSSNATITVAGTAALEAVSNGKPAILFSSIYANIFGGVVEIKSCDELEQLLKNVKEWRVVSKEIDEIEKKVLSFGLPGFIHDPRIVPEVTSQDNIERVARAIACYLRALDDRL